MSLSSLTVAVAIGCTCGEQIPPPTTNSGGGVSWVGLYNGAPFSWSTYIPPVVYIVTTGSTTNITTGQVAGVSKFMFRNDLYTFDSMRNINPDIVELQKVLLAENLLGSGLQTGAFDYHTKNAVEALQRKYGITPDSPYYSGYFGPNTRTFLNNR
jgi:peptidoglycan hydrolase-like protein with peptidoglycan-binding domain